MFGHEARSAQSNGNSTSIEGGSDQFICVKFPNRWIVDDFELPGRVDQRSIWRASTNASIQLLPGAMNISLPRPLL